MALDEDKTQVAATEEEYPCLEVLAGPKGAGRHLLRAGKNFIGRLSENDIVLDDSSVSRHHAVIEIRPDATVIVDQGSRNGTRLAGQKIEPETPIPLSHDSRIRIGAFQLRYLTQPAAPAEVEAPAEIPEEPAPPPEGMAFQGEVALPPPPSFWRRLRLPILVGVAGILMVVAGVQVFHFLTPKKVGEKPSATLREEEREKPGEMGEVLTPSPEPVPSSVPAPRPVFLDFSSSPIPARVYFNDQEVGQTPFRTSTRLEEGRWYEAKAIFQLPEVGETLEQRAQFQVPARAEIVPVAFNGPIGILKVSALPRDAALYLEGYFEKDPYQAKPIKFAEIVFGKPIYAPFGRYVVELRKSRQLEGSQTFVDQVVYRREFFLKADQTGYTIDVKDEDLQLFPVQLTTIPPSAKVFVDEKEVGVTPYTGTFPIGEHILTLKKEGYFDHSQAIKMEMSTPFVAEVTLKTSEAGNLINRANDLIRENRRTEALPLLVEAFNKTPTPRETAEISYLIGVCYFSEKSYKEAEDYFNRAMAHPDIKYQGRLGLASIAFQRGEKVAALQLLIEVMVAAEEPRIRSDAALLFQQLSPLKSVIYINSDPVAAAVFVNGQPLPQRSPVILHDLGIGSYRIEIKKEGYAPQEVKLNLGVAEFRPVVVTLSPLP